MLEPVLTYRVELPYDVDAAAMLPKLLQLEEEEPELHIVWEEEKKEIHAQIMGEIQMEILKSLIAERFGVEVRFGGRSIVYKETITDTVEASVILSRCAIMRRYICFWNRESRAAGWCLIPIAAKIF